MTKKKGFGSKWDYSQWCKHINSETGKIHENKGRYFHGRDECSQNYLESKESIQKASWYDIAPYTAICWTHYVAQNIRQGEWWYKRNNYGGVAIEMVTSGSIEYTFDNNTYTLQAGDVFISHFGETIKFGSTQNKYSEDLQICLSGGITNTIIAGLNLNECHFLNLHDTPYAKILRDKMKKFFSAFSERTKENAKANAILSYDLLLTIAEIYTQQDKTLRYPQLLTNAMKLIESKLTEKFSIEQLANELRVGRSTLNRLFQQNLNCTPYDFCNRLRMEKAKILLQDNKLSVKEIAVLSGNKNIVYFSSAFKKYSKLTPTEYRQKYSGSKS